MEDKIMLKLVGSSLVLVGIFYKIFLSVPMNSDFENGLKAMTESGGSVSVDLNRKPSPPSKNSVSPIAEKEVIASDAVVEKNLEALVQDAESTIAAKDAEGSDKKVDPKKPADSKKVAAKDPKKEKQEADKKKKEEQKKKVAAQQQKMKQWYQAAYQNWANESALEQAREQRRQELAQEVAERTRQQSANISTAPNLAPKTRPVTTAASDTSKYSAEEKRLRDNLFHFPSIANMNKFIDLYLQQKIQDAAFYGTVKDLVLSPSKEHQRIGMYALNAYPSVSSFAMLIELIDTSKDVDLKSSLQSILLNYTQVTSHQVLLDVLQHGKSRQILVALDLSQRFLQAVQNQKDNSINSVNPYDRFLQVLSGQLQNPDPTISVKSQQVYSQFQQARTLWMASAAAHVGGAGQGQ